MNKVTSLTNKDPYKLALAKSQGSFSRILSSFPPSMDWHKSKECLHYNFGSVATKQHVVSMLIDQQQTATETLQEYIQRFSDLLLKSSGLLQHQPKDLAHITHFICNLHNQKLQHYVLGRHPTSVQNAITLAQKRMWNSTLFKVYIVIIQAMKSTTLLINKLINKTTLDPALLVVAHTMSEIAMNQYAINADHT